MRSTTTRGLQATLFLVGLLGLARPSLGQEKPFTDPLDARFPAGDEIGRGVYKVAYRVQGQPDLVLLVSPGEDEKERKSLRGRLEREVGTLDALAARGIPVSEVVATGTYEGNPALAVRFYPTGYKFAKGSESQSSSNFQATRFRLLNENTLRSIEAIREGLKDLPFIFGDPQFLIGADGALHVSDPGKQFPLKGGPMASYAQQELEELHESLRRLDVYARQAIKARRMAGGALWSVFSTDQDGGRNATAAEVKDFVAEVERAGGKVIRADAEHPLPEGVHAETFLGADGKPTVLLPAEGSKVKIFALVDQLARASELAKAVASKGAASVKSTLEKDAEGDAGARRETIDWDLAASKAILSRGDLDPAQRKVVVSSVADRTSELSILDVSNPKRLSDLRGPRGGPGGANGRSLIDERVRAKSEGITDKIGER
jgi:hypothetical protein